MEAIVQQRERQSSLVATIGTIIVHALILLGLAWLVLMPPDPPLGGGQGMTMSLGEEGLGGPNDIPTEDPQPTPPTPEEQVTEESVATQETEEAPEVVEKKIETPKKKENIKPVETKKEPIEVPRKIEERTLFKKKTTTAATGGSGSGDIPGNEGRPDGDPSGSPDGNGMGNGTGTGVGNGTGNGIGDGNGDGVGGYKLTGRSISNRPKVEDNSKETGKVVVQIIVDRNGRVIEANPGFKGSTTLHPSLLAKAKAGAMQARFSPNPNAPEEQEGTITFVFKFKQ